MNNSTSIYTNVEQPGSFQGSSGFKKNQPKVQNATQIKKLDFFQLHKNYLKKFKRRQTFVQGIDDCWQVDLIDFKNFKHQNSHFSYILTVIDVFSKFAWALPLKNKQALSCKEAFNSIFLKSKRAPNYIYSDLGNEFKGDCQKLFKLNNIIHVKTKSKHKASIVERFNRTLKERIGRYFSYSKKKGTWMCSIKLLNPIINLYILRLVLNLPMLTSLMKKK